MNTLFNKFSLSFGRMRSDIEIPGSPERCLARFVAEDKDGNLWLVEKLKEAQANWRNTVGTLLTDLWNENVPFIHAPAQSTDGQTVVIHNDVPYQMTPFIIGTNLPRPAYCADKERGRAIGEFITSLQAAGKNIVTPTCSTPSLPEYVAKIVSTITKHRPDMASQLKTILPHLDTFFAEQDSIPLALAHGDCHPLNIVWQDKDIAGVIDWEFTGEKIVLYDAANCIGCVGIEHPNWLINGLVPELIATLYTKNEAFAANIHQLVPTILALRFAWLSEWLRKNDTEMQELELDYMRLIIRGREEIERFWKQRYMKG
ncbi:phosphotransferase enzyme family protein [Halodesulfovibrio marinisediminis]|uniref:Homoserine kinase type II n=1 Tax=Halodesulfovibrio marinisediminis DSM 17456 TaxID=1121457 RepID=A0A1N6IFB0_9BACT|nr:phosphotransferase [Halodesulfovibrio marinisediminis]SIO30625.1 homoserine kinase type II [Halodesulfovibrio marinisediminis DSM 17456]